ncbi:hypothetical protein C8R43DRAFT_1138993 [Mycena crocata]|nr:hypothetical protein C8R43DRAFT_1138993 [Mycena crocata]
MKVPRNSLAAIPRIVGEYPSELSTIVPHIPWAQRESSAPEEWITASDQRSEPPNQYKGSVHSADQLEFVGHIQAPIADAVFSSAAQADVLACSNVPVGLDNATLSGHAEAEATIDVQIISKSPPWSTYHDNYFNPAVFEYGNGNLPGRSTFHGDAWRWESFTALSPKRLYADIRPLLRGLSPLHPSFSKVTYLELIGSAENPLPNNMGIWSGLSLLPQLTHLSFNANEFIPICLPLLQSCKTLAVLICLDSTVIYSQTDRWILQEEGLQKDVRFVAITCRIWWKDWQMGILTGVDYWTQADDFVTKRRSGEIDALQFRIPGDASELVT